VTHEYFSSFSLINQLQLHSITFTGEGAFTHYGFIWRINWYAQGDQDCRRLYRNVDSDL